MTISVSAWKVWTCTICWNLLRQMSTKAFSSFAEAASCELTSWMKKRSSESGCLCTTYFMGEWSIPPCWWWYEEEEDEEWEPRLGQFSLSVDF